MLNLNWRFKALTQKLLWRLPGGVRMNAGLSRLMSGHDPNVELIQKHIPTFFRHWDSLRSARQTAEAPRATLEIGTGWDLDVALLMSLHGVQTVTTADVFRHVRFGQVRQSLSLFEALIPQIASHAERDPSIARKEWERLMNARSLDNLCECGRIRYLAPVSSDYREIQDDFIDFCCSTSVFEHVRPEEIRQILAATRCKLRPGGISSHIIDIKDHFAYFQKNLPYNNFLRYSRKAWEWWADNPMSYLNRMSPSDWRAIFQETGYEMVNMQAMEERGLPKLRPDMIHHEQRHRSVEDLAIGEIHVVARRR